MREVAIFRQMETKAPCNHGLSHPSQKCAQQWSTHLVLSGRWTAFTSFITISTPDFQGPIGRLAAMDGLFPRVSRCVRNVLRGEHDIWSAFSEIDPFGALA